MRASNLTSGSALDEVSLGLCLEPPELRERWIFAQALVELVHQQDASVDRTLSSWLMPAKVLNELCLLAMDELLGLTKGLQGCNQTLVRLPGSSAPAHVPLGY